MRRLPTPGSVTQVVTSQAADAVDHVAAPDELALEECHLVAQSVTSGRLDEKSGREGPGAGSATKELNAVRQAARVGVPRVVFPNITCPVYIFGRLSVSLWGAQENFRNSEAFSKTHHGEGEAPAGP